MVTSWLSSEGRQRCIYTKRLLINQKQSKEKKISLVLPTNKPPSFVWFHLFPSTYHFSNERGVHSTCLEIGSKTLKVIFSSGALFFNSSHFCNYIFPFITFAFFPFSFLLLHFYFAFHLSSNICPVRCSTV